MNNILLFQFLFLAGCSVSQPNSAQFKATKVAEVKSIKDQLDSLSNNGMLSSLMIEDFQDSTFADQAKCSGNCPTVKFEDQNGFMRAQLSGKMKVGYRSEVSFGKVNKLVQDSLYVLYFRVRFRADSAGTFPKSMFIQTHAVKSKEQKQNRSLVSWQSFVGRVEAGGNMGYWEAEKVNEKRKFKRFEIEANDWDEVLVFLRLSDGPQGSINVFRNGVKEFEASGPNSASWMKNQFLKLGVYSAQNSGKKAKYGEPSNAYRTTDFDDLRIYMAPISTDPHSLFRFDQSN